MPSFVMTIIGPDRPGLVDTLAQIVLEHDGNWVESRMAHLGGQFAGLLRVEVADEKSASLIARLRALDVTGLHVVLAPAGEEAPSSPERELHIELVGHDRPGIVRQLSGTLAAHGVNVEELETDCESAPMTGERLFRARARLRAPAGTSLDQLRSAIERIAAELMVDLHIAGRESP
ncbi:MAG TPA: ACT domain-containing protein [Planctomycetota bacterium]|nr:ACT domain-containing protein [Planctomycetota bacterium]